MRFALVYLAVTVAVIFTLGRWGTGDDDDLLFFLALWPLSLVAAPFVGVYRMGRWLRERAASKELG